MLKIKNGINEYDVTGHITFLNDDEVEQTNYSLVVDGGTITVTSFDSEWEVFEAPDPEPVVEEVPEPEPEPIIEVVPPSEEELARQAFEVAKAEWWGKKSILERMISDVKNAREIGREPSDEDMVVMNQLADWIDANMKQEYYF